MNTINIPVSPEAMSDAWRTGVIRQLVNSGL